jgi:hypothetical protein
LYVAALCAGVHSARNDFVRMVNEQLYSCRSGPNVVRAHEPGRYGFMQEERRSFNLEACH